MAVLLGSSSGFTGISVGDSIIRVIDVEELRSTDAVKPIVSEWSTRVVVGVNSQVGCATPRDTVKAHRSVNVAHVGSAENVHKLVLTSATKGFSVTHSAPPTHQRDDASLQCNDSISEGWPTTALGEDAATTAVKFSNLELLISTTVLLVAVPVLLISAVRSGCVVELPESTVAHASDIAIRQPCYRGVPGVRNTSLINS